MIYTIAAIYGNGGALPLEPLNLSEETRLKIVPEEAGDETQEASLPDLADGSARGV
ncbi:MAG TPA: antitoxin family protein [Blastocatellia bacterium]